MKDYKLEKLYTIIMNSAPVGERPPSDVPNQVSCCSESATQRSNGDDKKQSASRI